MTLEEMEAHKNECREKYKRMSVIDMAKAMQKLERVIADREEEQKKRNIEYDILRLECIPTKMEDEGIDKITIAGVGRVSITGDLYVHVAADLRESFYTWLRDHGHGDLIKPAVNPSTLKAFAKDSIKKGTELPGDLIKVTPFSRASITKG